MVYISSVIRSDIDPEKEITTCLLANEVTMVYIPSVIRSDIDPEKETTACLFANEA